MAATMRETRRRLLGESADSGVTWARIGQNRLDRLLELRAVVDSLRAEREQELLHDLSLEIRRS
jgi:hypothetical protein